MQLEATNCILCGVNAKRQSQDPLNMNYYYECSNCGKFFATSNVVDSGTQANYYLLAGYVNYANESKEYPKFTSTNISLYLDHPIMPRTILDKADKLLIHFFYRTEFYTQPVKISMHLAVCFAKNDRELFALYDLLDKQGYLVDTVRGGQRNNPDRMLMITSNGLSRCEEIKVAKHVESKTAFVAMWFGDDMRDVYNMAITPAIEECGYAPVRIDNVEHNNDITDEIIAGIKDSRFIVADMTGYRGGVYYEAGFARGLGIPVIFTCRKDWFDGEKDAEGRTVKEKIHFDINHQNIIVWKTEDDLKKRIVDHIRATIL